MVDINIKEATIENLKDIQDLNLALFKKEHNEYDDTLNLNWTFGKEGTDYFKKRIIEDNGYALVAESDGKIVGYLVGAISKAEFYRTISKIAEVENMLILEEYRSKGIGNELMDKFFSWCKSKGADRIKVVASAQNIKAINFYKKNGFLDYNLTLERNI